MAYGKHGGVKMNHTLFIRLLRHEDKDKALAESIAAVREGRDESELYTVLPESFRQVPNTTFCYWVSNRIRSLFKKLPPFENEGRTVKVGLQTGDDFRFVRLWWEVPAERILDSFKSTLCSGKNKEWTEERIKEFQAWCCRRTYEGKYWSPFAKGGEYSPYYADIHLVVNWEREGFEMKVFTSSVIRNPDYYFRPGLTWPRSTVKGLNMRILHAGCVFADKGPAGFVHKVTEISSTIGLFNSECYQLLLGLQQGSRAWEVGTIQKTAVPDNSRLNGLILLEASQKIWSLKRSLGMNDDTSHVFSLPALLKSYEKSLTEITVKQRKLIEEKEAELRRIKAEIDDIIFELYGFTEEERKVVDSLQGTGVTAKETEIEESDNKDKEETNTETSADNRILLSSHLISWCFGLIFYRWDIRLALNPDLATKLADPFDPLPVCPPGILQGPDGLPATPGNIVSEEWLKARPNAITIPPEGSVKRPTIKDEEYPVTLCWEGILVDDPDHEADIIRRMRLAFEVIWKDKADAIEQEACEILGIKDLRTYFRNPNHFFADHLKRYSKSRRKAPIYWPLSTPSCSYTLWIYYPRLNDQTLYKCVMDYIEPEIESVEREIKGINKQEENTASKRLKDLETATALKEELIQMKSEMQRIISLPYKPDLNDGVMITACPLHNLFQYNNWQKELKACWKKLEKGDYDWAHLAYSIWPDRVREKCKKDRSLAIAHDLEDVCEVKAAMKKRGKGKEDKEVVNERELF
jgi:hypothetical protein